jgi:hypothetical protein
MNVRLYETGQDGAPARIYQDICAATRFANTRNKISANEQIAPHDPVRFSHRQERTVFDENRLFHQRRNNKGKSKKVKGKSEAETTLN